MSRVTIKDKTFEVSITEEEIQQRVRAVADRINHDLQGKNPHLSGRSQWLVCLCRGLGALHHYSERGLFRSPPVL